MMDLLKFNTKFMLRCTKFISLFVSAISPTYFGYFNPTFYSGTVKCNCSYLLFLSCSPNSYPLVIAAHPQEPNQFALGLTDGGVHVFEPLESEAKWGAAPPVENGSAQPVENGSSRTTPAPAGVGTSADHPQG